MSTSYTPFALSPPDWALWVSRSWLANWYIVAGLEVAALPASQRDTERGRRMRTIEYVFQLCWLYGMLSEHGFNAVQRVAYQHVQMFKALRNTPLLLRAPRTESPRHSDDDSGSDSDAEEDDVDDDDDGAVTSAKQIPQDASASADDIDPKEVVAPIAKVPMYDRTQIETLLLQVLDLLPEMEGAATGATRTVLPSEDDDVRDKGPDYDTAVTRRTEPDGGAVWVDSEGNYHHPTEWAYARQNPHTWQQWWHGAPYRRQGVGPAAVFLDRDNHTFVYSHPDLPLMVVRQPTRSRTGEVWSVAVDDDGHVIPSGRTAWRRLGNNPSYEALAFHESPEGLLSSDPQVVDSARGVWRDHDRPSLEGPTRTSGSIAFATPYVDTVCDDGSTMRCYYDGADGPMHRDDRPAFLHFGQNTKAAPLIEGYYTRGHAYPPQGVPGNTPAYTERDPETGEVSHQAWSARDLPYLANTDNEWSTLVRGEEGAPSVPHLGPPASYVALPHALGPKGANVRESYDPEDVKRAQAMWNERHSGTFDLNTVTQSGRGKRARGEDEEEEEDLPRDQDMEDSEEDPKAVDEDGDVIPLRPLVIKGKQREKQYRNTPEGVLQVWWVARGTRLAGGWTSYTKSQRLGGWMRKNPLPKEGSAKPLSREQKTKMHKRQVALQKRARQKLKDLSASQANEAQFEPLDDDDGDALDPPARANSFELDGQPEQKGQDLLEVLQEAALSPQQEEEEEDINPPLRGDSLLIGLDGGDDAEEIPATQRLDDDDAYDDDILETIPQRNDSLVNLLRFSSSSQTEGKTEGSSSDEMKEALGVPEDTPQEEVDALAEDLVRRYGRAGKRSRFSQGFDLDDPDSYKHRRVKIAESPNRDPALFTTTEVLDRDNELHSFNGEPSSRTVSRYPNGYTDWREDTYHQHGVLATADYGPTSRGRSWQQWETPGLPVISRSDRMSVRNPNIWNIDGQRDEDQERLPYAQDKWNEAARSKGEENARMVVNTNLPLDPFARAALSRVIGEYATKLPFPERAAEVEAYTPTSPNYEPNSPNYTPASPDASWAQAQRRSATRIPPPSMSLDQHSRDIVSLALAALRMLPDSVTQVHGAFYRTAIQAVPSSLLSPPPASKTEDSGGSSSESSDSESGDD
jgi:hypothetical protein